MKVGIYISIHIIILGFHTSFLLNEAQESFMILN